MLFLASNAPQEPYTQTWECIYWLHVFTPSVSLYESQLLVEPCSPCIEMKTSCLWLIYLFLQMTNRTSSQVSVWCIFLRRLKCRVLIQYSVQEHRQGSSFFKESPNLSADGWKKCIDRMIHLFMHTFNFSCSKQENVQCFTSTLRFQMQQYILCATNKILLIIDLGIIRKCNWI